MCLQAKKKRVQRKEFHPLMMLSGVKTHSESSVIRGHSFPISNVKIAVDLSLRIKEGLWVNTL